MTMIRTECSKKFKGLEIEIMVLRIVYLNVSLFNSLIPYGDLRWNLHE